MKISYAFKKSILSRLLKWSFVNSNDNLFDASKLLKILSRFDNTKLSMLFMSLSLACLWYEALFTNLGFVWVESWNLGTICLLLSVIFCDKRRLLSTRAIVYLLLFITTLLLSSLIAAINGIELGMLMTGILLFSQFTLAFIVSSTCKSKLALINTILILSTPLLIVGIYQGFWGGATSKLWVSGAETLINARAFGFFGSPNVMGSLMMITTVVALFAWLDKKRWYYIIYGLFSSIVLVMTFSRSAWLGLFVGLAVTLLIKNWRLIFFAPLSLMALFIPSIKQRLLIVFSREYLVDAALDGRTWSMANAVEIFKTSPIFGTGPGTYGGQTAVYYNSPIYLRGMQNGYIALPYTDNQWLQILVQTGLVGFIFVFGFFVSHIVNNLIQYKKSNNYLSLSIIAVAIAVLVNGIFANIWEFSAISVVSGAYLGLGNNYED